MLVRFGLEGIVTKYFDLLEYSFISISSWTRHLHIAAMIFQIMPGNFLSLYFQNSRTPGAESLGTIACLLTLSFGYCAPVPHGETCRRTTVTGKIPIDVSADGGIKAFGRNYLKHS